MTITLDERRAAADAALEALEDAAAAYVEARVGGSWPAITRAGLAFDHAMSEAIRARRRHDTTAKRLARQSRTQEGS